MFQEIYLTFQISYNMKVIAKKAQRVHPIDAAKFYKWCESTRLFHEPFWANNRKMRIFARTLTLFMCEAYSPAIIIQRQGAQPIRVHTAALQLPYATCYNM